MRVMLVVLGSKILATDDKAQNETDTVPIFKADDAENKQINMKKLK